MHIILRHNDDELEPKRRHASLSSVDYSYAIGDDDGDDDDWKIAKHECSSYGKWRDHCGNDWSDEPRDFHETRPVVHAKLLDGKGTYLAVDEASSGIVTNDVDGVAAVELHGGEALSLTWGTAAHPAVRRGFVKVTGEGTLTVTLNGKPFGTYTVTDGAAEFAVPAAGLDAFGFTFAGEGSADLYGFSAKLGTVLMVR